MPRLSGIQSLRALAAIMVLIGHVIAEAEHYFEVSLPGDLIPWTRGVDIFFVISGFIITLSGERFANRPGSFLWRRFLRVAPLYYVFTTLMVMMLVLLPSGSKDTVFDPAQILSSYGFFPYERHDGRIAPILSLGWTLNYEVFFYALFAATLALPRRLIWITGVLIALAVLGSTTTPTNPQLVFWSNPIVLEFLFGVALARAWQMGFRRADQRLAWLAIVFGVILLIILNFAPLPRFVASGLPAALIVAGGTLFWPSVHDAPGQKLGDASYALYLSHRFTLRALTLLLVPLLPASPWAAGLFFALACALSLAIALLTHRHIEQPLHNAVTRQSRQEAPA